MKKKKPDLIVWGIVGVNLFLVMVLISAVYIGYLNTLSRSDGNQTPDSTPLSIALLPTAPAPESLMAQAQNPAVLRTGEQFNLIVRVQNTGASALQVEAIILPQIVVDGALVNDVFPAATGQENSPTGVAYRFNTVVGAGEDMRFNFSMTARQALDYNGDITLLTRSQQVAVATHLVIENFSTTEGATLIPPLPMPLPATESPVVASPSSAPLPYLAVVQITAFYNDGGQLKDAWSGSGTIISPDGLILTNAHVVLPDGRQLPIDALQVSLTHQPEQPAAPTYFAEVMQADVDLDLAVIRISTDLQRQPLDRATLNLPFVALGDSDLVQLGDALTILGYPGIGGKTITLTRGDVSGFTGQPALGDRAYFKTSAAIVGGNSGGMAINQRSELIGIPSRVGAGGDQTDETVDCRVIADTNRDGVVNSKDSCVTTGGFINALRPLKFALPLIEAAKRGEVYIPQPAITPVVLPLGGALLLTDDFSDPRSGWTRFNDTSGMVDYLNGKYRIRINDQNYVFGGIQATNSYGEVMVQVKAQTVSPTGYASYGVICRYQDKRNYYFLAITEDGFGGIFRMQNLERTALFNWQASPSIPRSGEVQLTAACLKDQLTLAVNGVVVAQANDSAVTQGNVGLFAATWKQGGLDVDFDDIEIKAP